MRMSMWQGAEQGKRCRGGARMGTKLNTGSGSQSQPFQHLVLFCKAYDSLMGLMGLMGHRMRRWEKKGAPALGKRDSS